MNTYHLTFDWGGRTVSRETAAPDLEAALLKVSNYYGAAVAVLTHVVSVNGEAV